MRATNAIDPKQGLWLPAAIPSGNRAPVPRLDAPTAGRVGDLLTFDAGQSHDLDGGSGDPITFAFSLSAPPGSSATLQQSSTTVRRLTPDVDGTYTVTVTVTDDGGAARGATTPISLSSSLAISVVVSEQPAGGNKAPEVTLTGPATGKVGTGSLTYTHTVSDPDGDPAPRTVTLTRPAGSTAILDTSGGTSTFTPDVDGAYAVTVSSTDDGGAGRGVTNPVPLTATKTVTTNVAPKDPTGERLGSAGARRVVGWFVITDTTMVESFTAQESDMGRTTSANDPLIYCSSNIAHFDAAPPLTGWEHEVTKFIDQWGARSRGPHPVKLCVIVHLYGSSTSNPTPANRRVYLANLRDGVYDVQWNAQIARLKAAGFAPHIVARIGHESELTPHRTSAKFTHVTSPGSLSHLKEMEALWRDAVEHLMFLWTSEGFKVSYPGNGGWFNPSSQGNLLGPDTHPDYANMPAWQFGIPSPDVYYDFGCDLYVGGGATSTFDQWQAQCEKLAETAASLGKPFSIPEWGVWKAKNGKTQNFTATQVTNGVNRFLDWVEYLPASGPGSAHYLNYFPAGRAQDVDGTWKYGMTDMSVHWPSAYQAIWRERLGNK